MTTARRNGRGEAPARRALIGPLVMLVVGAAASAFLWRTLMLEPPDGVGRSEQLSWKERQALERLLHAPSAR